MSLECFITEKGVERKAGMEDLLPILGENRLALQHIIRECNKNAKIYLASVLAYLPGEIKEIVYGNMSPRVAGRLKKQVRSRETGDRKHKSYAMQQKEKLIDFIGRHENIEPLYLEFPEHITFRPHELKEEEILEMLEPSITALEAFTKEFEEALESGKLDIAYIGQYMTHKDMRKVFQNNFDKLPKIRRLSIRGKDLPVAALLFETGKIEELYVSGDVKGKWPPFMENCQALIKLELPYCSRLSEFPSWIRNAPLLRELSIGNTKIASVPEWIGEFRFLTKLSLFGNKNLKTLPDSIGNLKNLDKLEIRHSPIRTLPDSMGNLKNLTRLYLDDLLIKEMPEWIGGFRSLTVLSLRENKVLRKLPASIGSLKNLIDLNLGYSPIKKLPDSIINCTSLRNVDILGTKVSSVPDFILSVKSFKDNKIIQLIPQGPSLSYECFCNSYYKIVKAVFNYNEKSMSEGLLALEEKTEFLAEGFFKRGMRMLVDGTDAETIQNILGAQLERESNYYRRKLMETAMEGILCMEAGYPEVESVFTLASVVKIKNNPLEDHCAKYLAGKSTSISDIDFEALMLPEEEREETRFIKRAMALSEKARREGLLALEECLDRKGIAGRDVFEYGLPLIIDGMDSRVIEKVLDNLVERETDPVRKNFAQAKKATVMSINGSDNPRVLCQILLAYFDEDITGEFRRMIDD
jgi:flagellar motor component MotA